MSDSAESVVRKFHAAWRQSDLDGLVSFFSDDAVYTDGPRGVHRGIDAIRAELAAMVKMVPSTAIDIKTLVANGGTVMVERVDTFEIAGSRWIWKWPRCLRSTITAASRVGVTTTT